jgi:hypothetical protein
MWRDAPCTQLEDDDVEMAADFPSVQGRARVQLIELSREDVACLMERMRGLPPSTRSPASPARLASPASESA